MISEAAVHIGGEESRFFPGTYRFGAWYDTANFPDQRLTFDEDLQDFTEDPANIYKRDYGIYGGVDQMLWREKKGKAEGFSVFFIAGGVPNDRNFVDSFIGTGMTYRGLLPDRDEDVFGSGVAYAAASNAVHTVGGSDANETIVETFYRAQIFPWFALQPDLQFVIHPGMNQSLPTATVFLLRFEISV